MEQAVCMLLVAHVVFRQEIDNDNGNISKRIQIQRQSSVCGCVHTLLLFVSTLFSCLRFNC